MIDIPDFILPKDAEGRVLCPKCGRLSAECSCPEIAKDVPARKAPRYHLRLERSGRKGKTVTLVTGLPLDNEYVKELAKVLKQRTGAGGTYYLAEKEGVIELQGDQRSAIRQFASNGLNNLT